MKELEWQKEGLCRGIEPEVFFPAAEEDAWRAKEICEACPVKEPCLIGSLRNRERYGVWGAVSEKERQDMFRRGVAQRILAGDELTRV